VSIRVHSWRKTTASTNVERTLQKNFFLQNKAKLTQLGQSGQLPPPFLHQKSTLNFTRQKNEAKRTQFKPKTNPNSDIFFDFMVDIT
jgi:hypothetical protein